VRGASLGRGYAGNPDVSISVLEMPLLFKDALPGKP